MCLYYCPNVNSVQCQIRWYSGCIWLYTFSCNLLLFMELTAFFFRWLSFLYTHYYFFFHVPTGLTDPISIYSVKPSSCGPLSSTSPIAWLPHFDFLSPFLCLTPSFPQRIFSNRFWRKEMLEVTFYWIRGLSYCWLENFNLKTIFFSSIFKAPFSGFWFLILLLRSPMPFWLLML